MDGGREARQILSFAWGETERNSWLVTNALRTVCQTFSTSPEESGRLLMGALEPDHLADYGYEEMPVITRELWDIAGNSPELVMEIYGGVFGHEETSDDTTNMSGSHILALTSNRKQGYDHSKWQLGQYYPIFAKDHPLLAAEAMIKVIDAYRIREHSTENPPENFKTTEPMRRSYRITHSYGMKALQQHARGGRDAQTADTQSFNSGYVLLRRSGDCADHFIDRDYRSEFEGEA